MVFACGLSHYSTALFHLFNHALFKALLFLSAGSIIHGLCDEQDLRKMGGLVQIFPIAFVMLLIGSVALTGIPFYTGFYSKDAILEVAASNGTFVGLLTFLLGVFAASCTAYYSARLVFLVFINTPNAFKFYFLKAHEPSLIMLIPLFLLAFGSIFVGFCFKDLFLGLGTSYFKASIFYNFKFSMLSAEFLHAFFKNIPLIFTLLGFLLSFFLLFFLKPSILPMQTSLYSIKMSRSVIRYLYIFLNYK
jgi:NADH:ubiquinone oxidoreductase subunit 5 (subunit L)/multisubunit Na+/H+ antiporter MnhA subunit